MLKYLHLCLFSFLKKTGKSLEKYVTHVIASLKTKHGSCIVTLYYP